MLNALFNVCESSDSNTLRESFTTEAFCGVLKSDTTLLENFLYEFAGIKNETNFEIITEKTYAASRIDVVIKNKNYLIFLEIKVDSKEGIRDGVGQLEIYASILKKLSSNTNQKPILLFCTKEPEEKDKNTYLPIEFRQLRWNGIYHFLKKHHGDNYLAQSFINYLEIQSMVRSSFFSADDLKNLSLLKTSLKPLSECIQQVKKIFTTKYFIKTTNNKNTPLTESVSEIYNRSQYGISRFNLLTKDNSNCTSLHAYIDLDSTTNVSSPKLVFSLWVNDYHPMNDVIIGELKNLKLHLDDAILEHDNDEDFCVTYEKSISDFLSDDEDQLLFIEKWFDDKMKLIHQYMTQYSQLDWDVKRF